VGDSIWRYGVNRKARKAINRAQRLKLLLSIDLRKQRAWHIWCGSEKRYPDCPFRLRAKSGFPLCLSPRNVEGCYLFHLEQRAREIVPRIQAWERRVKVEGDKI